LLARLKNKAFIIASYSSLKTLNKHGIVPDVAIAIDRLQGLYHIDISPEMLAVPLLFISATDSRVLERATGKKIFAPVQDDSYILDLYSCLGREEGTIFASGSVAVAATDFAVIAGCDPIIFVGQDLAFTGKKIHSEVVNDTPEYIEQQLDAAFLADDIFGEKVLTDSMMQMYKRTLEEYIRCYTEPEYIDATEGGVYIAGTEICPLSDVVARVHCSGLTDQISDILKTHLDDDYNRTFDNHHAAEFLHELKSIHNDIMNNPDYCELANISEETVDNDNNDEHIQLDEHIQRIERVFDFIEKRAELYSNEYRYAKNQFAKSYGENYVIGSCPNALKAYIEKSATIARILKPRLVQYTRVVSLH
jgi:hypothetical protein